MNFGSFGGGFSSGFNNGVSMGKSIRDAIKEKKLQDLREQGMAEAEATRVKTVGEMIKENGVPERPVSGPVETKAPVVAEAPASAPAAAPATPAAAQPGNPYDPGDTRTDPKPVAASPGAVTPGQSVAPPSVSTQAPAPTPAPEAAVQPAQPAQAAPNFKAIPMTPQAIAAAGTAAPASTSKFTVNGQGYDTREAAQAAAEKAAPSATDLFIKNTVPKISQSYITQGDPEKAQAWDTWAEAGKNKRAIKDWAAAFTAPDMDTAVSKFGKYYTDHINDDVDYTGHKLLTKADGSQVAVVTLKDKKTGKSTEMELTREKMLALGGANNPQKIFEQESAKQASAEKFRFEQKIKSDERRFELGVKSEERRETSKENRERDDRKADRDDARSERVQNGLDGRAGAGVNAKLDAQVGALRDAGYPDEEIKRMMPALVGAGDHKKTTDPTERRALVTGDLLKNDPTFGRATPAEQAKKVDALIGVIYGTEGKPAAAQPAAAPSSNPNAIYRNNETGERFRVVNGKRVPVGALPTAGGPPPKAATPAAAAAGGIPPKGASGSW